MSGPVLVAGLGNIFHGDDGFGVIVVRRLASAGVPENVRIMDIGIRGIDLGFALLDEYELVILIDATARGGAPGTLYTIEIRAGDIPDCVQESMVNSHGLNPERVLALAKSMGARLRKVLLMGCEPGVLDRDQSGYIGLSEIVEASVDPAVQVIQRLIEDFTKKEEVFSHEYV